MKTDALKYNTNVFNNNVNACSESRSKQGKSNHNVSYGATYYFYKNQKNKQGFIGKAIDACKNLLGLKSGSKYIENQFDVFRLNINDKEAEDNAIKLANRYAKSQLKATCIARNIFSALCAGASLFLLNKAGLKNSNKAVSALICTAAGAAGAVGLKFLDAKSAKRKYKGSEIANDAIQGSISGGLNYISELLVLDIGNISSTIFKKVLKFGIKGVIKLSAIFSPAAIESAILGRKINVRKSGMAKISELKEENENVDYFDPRINSIENNIKDNSNQPLS